MGRARYCQKLFVTVNGPFVPRSMAQNEYEIRGSSLFSGTVRGSKLNFARPQSLPHRKNIRLPEIRGIRKCWTTLTFCAQWFLERSARIHSTLSIPFPLVFIFSSRVPTFLDFFFSFFFLPSFLLVVLPFFFFGKNKVRWIEGFDDLTFESSES